MSALLPPTMSPETRACVTVDAPARLHLGFLDPSGSLGRRFGSVGLVIGGLQTQVEISPAAADAVLAATADAQQEIGRAMAHLQRLREHTGRRQPLQLRLLQVLPAHAGLGSGTQLALAVGRAFARWHGLEITSTTLAAWLGRGLRSGVGIAGFDHGGLLVDGGPSGGQPASLLSRIELPAGWRVIVVQDGRLRGLSGRDERQAIAALPVLPQALAADLCHQVLMRVLPGAAAAEFAPFAAGVNRVQRLLGQHFAPAQQGHTYTSAAVGRLLQWLGAVSLEAVAADSTDDAAPVLAAVGQSSWGPTGFAIVPSQASAEALLLAARAAGMVDAALEVSIVAGRNRGAAIHDGRSSR